MATSINTAEIPVSIVASATAASYTVPSDRYAVVRAQVSDTGSISVNGVLVLGAYSWSAINSSNGIWRMPGSPTFSNGLGSNNDGYLPGMLAVGSVPTNGTGNMASGGTSFPGLVRTATGGAFTYGAVTMSGGQTLSLVNAFANSTASETSNHTFKVPSGSIIVGSGSARYLIELYRIPGSAT